jgi:8-oxo-dGTP pyrophosphatase MutT (NUDIX family)
MEPRLAATVIVARAEEGAPEILALRRAERSRFAPGFVVFPGGVIETGDADLAGRLFGDRGEEARACALRELYEEAGLLLTAAGLIARPPDGPVETLAFEPPAPAALVEVSRWVAPEFLEVRFDARFFAVEAPAGLGPVPDDVEIAEAMWAPAADLLAEAEQGRGPLMWPTLITLRALAECRTVEDVMALHVSQVPRPR